MKKYSKKHFLIGAVAIAAIMLTPFLLKKIGYSYLIAIMVLVAIFGIVVVGFDLLVGYSGQFSVAQPAFLGIGAYGSALLTTDLGFSPLPALLISLLIASLVALILGYSTLRFKHFYLVLVTLAFGDIFYRVLLGFPNFTGGPAGVFVDSFSIFGFKFYTDTKFYYLAWALAIGSYLLANNLVKSGWGRSLLALHDDDVASGCMGINISRLKIEVFVISCAYASVGGSLFAHFLSYITPIQFSVHMALDLILMIFIGGVRTLWGGFIGVAIIKSLPEALEWFKDYRTLCSGTLLILIFIFMRRGIAGTLMRLWKK